MRSYDVFFWGALFFLCGVLLASVGVRWGILALTFMLTVMCLAAARWHGWRFLKRLGWARKGWFLAAALSLFIPVGALYHTWDDRRLRTAEIPFGERVEVTGVVVSDPVQRGMVQEAVVTLEAPFSGNVLLRARPTPALSYGDRVRLAGPLAKPEPGAAAARLAKDRVGGTLSFPEVELLARGKGSPLRAALFKLKHAVIGTFREIFSPKEAALMGGLTLGERADFSADFREAMQKSGTTHLVALSGYNITVIVWAVAGLLLPLVGRRWSLAATALVIAGFVMMTGAEASVVRAAIMGALVLLAREVGRIYSFRNAIAAAALAMVLVNPKVLAWDLGFQLSFLALLGIVYLRPALVALARVPEDGGVLSWRENLLTTVSAQLAVAPLLITAFGGFSAFAIIANVAVLGLVPLTMGLGFVVAAARFLSYHFALALGWIALVPLRFEIAVIEFFGGIGFTLSPMVSAATSLLYYGCLTGVIIYARCCNRGTEG